MFLAEVGYVVGVFSAREEDCDFLFHSFGNTNVFIYVCFWWGMLFRLMLFFLLLIIGVVGYFASFEEGFIDPKDLELESLDDSEVILGEGDICSNNLGPKCRSGLVCDVHPDFPNVDGVCVKPENVSSVYNVRG